ncbi:MAG TPA: DUF3465 domain-containing protein [Thermoleophilia bacterium]|nr:DUF3465 domain-containing protein [Thermoleophilia bacterium]
MAELRVRLARAALPPILLSLCWVVALEGGCASSDGEAGGGATSTAAAGDAALAEAYAERAHDLRVEGQGTVDRVLKDDTEGGRHQRFIVRLASGQTLLIAHNIDVAPRVADLHGGDAVAFRGVYEWSEEGGSVHWTHDDPEGQREPGWIRHDGRTYE